MYLFFLIIFLVKFLVSFRVLEIVMVKRIKEFFMK